MKKNYSILLSLIAVFAMSGTAFAVDPFDTKDGGWSGPSVIKPVPPLTTTTLIDPLFFDRLQEMKELTPTPANLDITNNIPLNLAGTQMRVIPLEDTRIVNNLPGSFDKGTVGAIALNDSADRILAGDSMIAVGDLTPIGAASQVGNTDGLEIENYDFIIPQAIVE